MEILVIASADMKTPSAVTVSVNHEKLGEPVEGIPQTIGGPDPAPNEEAKKLRKFFISTKTVLNDLLSPKIDVNVPKIVSNKQKNFQKTYKIH